MIKIESERDAPAYSCAGGSGLAGNSKFKLEFSQRSDGGSANVLHLNRLEWHNGSSFAIVKLEGSATPEMLRVLASSLMCIASDMEEYQKTATELARL